MAGFGKKPSAPTTLPFSLQGTLKSRTEICHGSTISKIWILIIIWLTYSVFLKYLKAYQIFAGVWDLESLQCGKHWLQFFGKSTTVGHSNLDIQTNRWICMIKSVEMHWFKNFGKFYRISDFTSKQILMSNVFVEVAWFITKWCALSGLSLSQPFLPRTRKAKLYNLGTLFFPFTLVVNESKSLNQMTFPRNLSKTWFVLIKKIIML